MTATERKEKPLFELLFAPFSLKGRSSRQENRDSCGANTSFLPKTTALSAKVQTFCRFFTNSEAKNRNCGTKTPKFSAFSGTEWLKRLTFDLDRPVFLRNRSIFLRNCPTKSQKDSLFWQKSLPFLQKSLCFCRNNLIMSHNRFTYWQGSFCFWLSVCSFLLAPDASGAAREPKAPSPRQLEQSIQRGVGFLLKDQNKDGSWGSATKTKDLNIFAPIPGSHQAFRAACTALAISALIEAGATNKNSAQPALGRAENWLLKNLPRVRRADGVAIYNVWAHGYGIQALVRMHRRAAGDADRQEEIRKLILLQMDLLRRYESVDGGWGYYDFRYQAAQPSSDSISFVNATVLIAFHEAAEIGVHAPTNLVRRAIAATRRQRNSDFTYQYGEYLKWRPVMPVNRAGGSLGRSQACNVALRHWGDTNVTDTVMLTWLQKLIDRNGWLSIGRKRPIPHESWFQVAGYFFYYGHYYAALCVEELGPDKAGKYKAPLAAIITGLQEKDGSWFDFPFYDYHQPYGTAFALMTLVRCRP